jgi:hypothetical protein
METGVEIKNRQTILHANSMWAGGWDNRKLEANNVLMLHFAPPTDFLASDFIDYDSGQLLSGTYVNRAIPDKGSFIVCLFD